MSIPNLSSALRRQCGFYRMKERGRTNYPEEEHLRDCALCQAAIELHSLQESDLALSEKLRRCNQEMARLRECIVELENRSRPHVKVFRLKNGHRYYTPVIEVQYGSNTICVTLADYSGDE